MKYSQEVQDPVDSFFLGKVKFSCRSSGQHQLPMEEKLPATLNTLSTDLRLGQQGHVRILTSVRFRFPTGDREPQARVTSQV